MKGYRKELRFFPMFLAVTILTSSVIAETIHVDSRNGSDEKPAERMILS